jgi:hypothetical protein
MQDIDQITDTITDLKFAALDDHPGDYRLGFVAACDAILEYVADEAPL